MKIESAQEASYQQVLDLVKTFNFETDKLLVLQIVRSIDGFMTPHLAWVNLIPEDIPKLHYLLYNSLLPLIDKQMQESKRPN